MTQNELRKELIHTCNYCRFFAKDRDGADIVAALNAYAVDEDLVGNGSQSNTGYAFEIEGEYPDFAKPLSKTLKTLVVGEGGWDLNALEIYSNGKKATGKDYSAFFNVERRSENIDDDYGVTVDIITPEHDEKVYKCFFGAVSKKEADALWESL